MLERSILLLKWNVKNHCRSAVLHCRSVVALKTSLLERTVGARIFTDGAHSQNARALWVRQMTTEAHIETAGARIQIAGEYTAGSAHCECRRAHSDCRNVVLHCPSVVAPKASLPKRTTRACSCIAGASYQNAEVLWDCRSAQWDCELVFTARNKTEKAV
ncbi:hypothetical protein AMTRI_Chr12g275450 [Amborella trichopoda]